MISLVLACSRPVPADLVVIADPIVEVVDGRIRAVHPIDSDTPVAIGPETRVIRAARVTAGFVDAHGHPDGLGRSLSELDLWGAASYAETLERLAKAPAGDGWVLGRGWDQEDWADVPDGGWPLASDLEKVLPGRKVLLRRVDDGHTVWVSTAALAEAGLTAANADPPGGRIVRDGSGAPTGVLVDSAVLLVKTPAPSIDEERRRLRAALVLIVANGLTGVHMMGASDEVLEILDDLDRAQLLPVRLWVYVDPDTEAAARLAREGPWAGDRLKVVGVKAYADGALGSRGALLSAPYTDDPGQSGMAQTTPEELARLAETQLASGSSLAVHAIGDLAVRRTLDAFAAARAAHPDRSDVPLRVEHAQVVHPDDVPRFADLGVIASMQPTHASSDGPWAPARLGPERIGWAYAWKTLQEAGAPLAFGSDFPVEEVDPALGLVAATTRPGWTARDQVLTWDVAVAAFTSGAAHAVREDANLGTLEVGKLADLTLWRVEPGGGWAAAGVVVGGEVVASPR